jgi:hypothetical protein
VIVDYDPQRQKMPTDLDAIQGAVFAFEHAHERAVGSSGC